MGMTSKGTTCPLQIMTLSPHVSKIASPLVPGCPGTERRYLVIPLGTVFNFRTRFRSTMSHSFFADGDGGGESEILGALALRAVKFPFVVVIEHHPDVFAEAGAEGGHLVAQGTPEQVATHPTSRTAPFLKAIL